MWLIFLDKNTDNMRATMFYIQPQRNCFWNLFELLEKIGMSIFYMLWQIWCISSEVFDGNFCRLRFVGPQCSLANLPRMQSIFHLWLSMLLFLTSLCSSSRLTARCVVFCCANGLWTVEIQALLHFLYWLRNEVPILLISLIWTRLHLFWHSYDISYLDKVCWRISLEDK